MQTWHLRTPCSVRSPPAWPSLEITRKRAEEMVRDFVREGEVGREHAEEWVEEIMTRSRRNAELLTELVTGEVRRQVEALGLMRFDEAPKLFEQFLTQAWSTGERTVRDVAGRAERVRRTAAGGASTVKRETEGPASPARRSAAGKKAAATGGRSRSESRRAAASG